MKNYTTLPLVLLLLSFVPYKGITQFRSSDCDAILYAKIIDSRTGFGVHNAKLELLKNGHSITQQFADNQGMLKLSPYDCGIYDIVVILDGYLPQKIMDISFTKNTSLELEIGLYSTLESKEIALQGGDSFHPFIRIRSTQKEQTKSKSKKFLGHVVDIIKEIK